MRNSIWRTSDFPFHLLTRQEQTHEVRGNRVSHEIQKERLFDRERSIPNTQTHPSLHCIDGPERGGIKMPDALDHLSSGIATHKRANPRSAQETLACPQGLPAQGGRTNSASLCDRGLNQGFFPNFFKSPDAGRQRGNHPVDKAHPQSLPWKDCLPRCDYV